MARGGLGLGPHLLGQGRLLARFGGGLGLARKACGRAFCVAMTGMAGSEAELTALNMALVIIGEIGHAAPCRCLSNRDRGDELELVRIGTHSDLFG
jgi:hypothetical protein